MNKSLTIVFVLIFPFLNAQDIPNMEVKVKEGYKPSIQESVKLNTNAIDYDTPLALDGEIGWGHRLQASRNENGSKVFALWNDVNIEEFETDLLEFPDIFDILLFYHSVK